MSYYCSEILLLYSISFQLVSGFERLLLLQTNKSFSRKTSLLILLIPYKTTFRCVFSQFNSTLAAKSPPKASSNFQTPPTKSLSFSPPNKSALVKDTCISKNCIHYQNHYYYCYQPKLLPKTLKSKQAKKKNWYFPLL